MSSFKVHVSKDYTIFCAGHFITYGDQCEPVHGHNYRAAATLEGDLDENAYVFDFTALKKLLRALCDRLDHRMLLPRDNPRLTLDEEGESISVRFERKTYVFPREDVVVLPLPNTTAEMLAEWLAGQIEADLRARGANNLTALEVEVEEVQGQSAFARRALNRLP
jgi:6-pyruvoyltetrahydropterin/6-carboxytetrahydropterin synthase